MVDQPPHHPARDTPQAPPNNAWWEMVFDPDDDPSPVEPRPQTPPTARYRQPPAEPRILVLGWCIWLLGSWLATMSGEMSIAAAQRMIFASMIGLLAVWPAVRLSEPPRPARAFGARHPQRGRLTVVLGVWMDWLCLFAVFQLVLWSITIGVGWSARQALWLDTAVAAWSLITAAIVAWGALGRSPGRALLAMAACLAMILAEPILWWTFSELTAARLALPAMRLTPIETIWTLSQPPAAGLAESAIIHVLAALTAASILWAGLVAATWLTPQSPDPLSNNTPSPPKTV